MPALNHILDRFRPAPSPGRAGPVGVPSDSKIKPADELGPIFAALAAVQAECQAILARSDAQADDVVRSSRERVATIEAEAVVRAETARTTVAAAARTAVENEHAEVLLAARVQAAEIAAQGAAAIPSQVLEAVERVRALAAERR
jgi:hypothetical protein